MRFVGFMLAAASIGSGQAPGPSPAGAEARKAKMAEMGDRQGKLKPGDLAPEFNLKNRGTSEYVQLSSFRGRKCVALVFGSYT
jgi:hypothetical protein